MAITPEEFRKGSLLALILTGANLLTLPVLAGVFEVLRRQDGLTARPFFFEAWLAPLLAGAGLLSYLLIHYFRPRLLRQKATAEQGAALAGPLQNLIRATVVTNGIAEISAIVGFLCAFTTGNGSYLYAGLGLSAILYWLYFPRKSQWEEWKDSIINQQ